MGEHLYRLMRKAAVGRSYWNGQSTAQFSRGRLRVTGPNPSDPIEIVAKTFSDPADRKALIRAIALCREIGNSAAMSPFVKREIMPGNLTGRALESFVRDAVVANLHQNCTAKMGPR